MYKKRKKDLLRGRRLRDLRVRHELTQRELAALVGLSQSHVTRWETGSLPADETLAKLAKALKTSVDFISLGEVPAGEPTGEAWDDFLRWLPGHWVQTETLPWMLDSLREFKFPEGTTVCAEQYQRMLFVLVDIEKQSRMRTGKTGKLG